MCFLKCHSLKYFHIGYRKIILLFMTSVKTTYFYSFTKHTRNTFTKGSKLMKKTEYLVDRH